jgi:hypothetical protein
MRTFHWIVQFYISKMGKDHLLLFNRIYRELEREDNRSRKFYTHYSYPGILAMAEEKSKIIVVGDRGHITPQMLEALHKYSEDKSAERIEPIELKIEDRRPKIDVERIHTALAISPKEFGERKLGKPKKK